MLRIAPAVPLSQIELPADGSPVFLRLADTSGSFAGQHALRQLGPGMYGVMQKSSTVTGDRYAIRLHTTLPTSLAGLGQVEIFPHSSVEVIKADNVGDFAMLGLQYLARLGDMIKSRLSLGGQEANDMMAGYLRNEMPPHAKKLATMMEQGGVKVVEVEETAVVKRTIYFVTDANAAIANLNEGAGVDEGMSFTFDDASATPTRVVKLADSQSIEDLLVQPKRVTATDAAAMEVQDAITMSPFLAALTNTEQFLDDDDAELDGDDLMMSTPGLAG